MFKHRLITALIIAPVFIAAIIFLQSGYIAVILGVTVLIGGWEWTRLVGLQKNILARVSYCMLLAFVFWACWYYVDQPDWPLNMFIISAGFWLLAIFWIMRFPLGEKVTLGNIFIKCATGLLVLVPTWVALVILHKVGYSWFIYLLVLIWVADSGAYFAGKAWGNTKLAPKVSPGKSWEGVAGALIMGSIYAVAGTYWLEINPANKLAFVLLSIMIIPVSILGDLFESMMKRHSGFKDSGNILPGHGGILDRIDSLTSAAPIFVAGILLLQLVPSSQ